MSDRLTDEQLETQLQICDQMERQASLEQLAMRIFSLPIGSVKEISEADTEWTRYCDAAMDNYVEVVRELQQLRARVKELEADAKIGREIRQAARESKGITPEQIDDACKERERYERDHLAMEVLRHSRLVYEMFRCELDGRYNKFWFSGGHDPADAILALEKQREETK